MKFVPPFLNFVASGVLLSAALVGAAQADTVQVREVNTGAGMSSGGLFLPVQANAANFWTGFQTISVTAGSTTNSFQAFCIDPFQWSSGTASAYNRTTLAPTFGAAKVADINKLFNLGYADAVGNNLNAAAFQWALWEVANDDGDLGEGSVRWTDLTNADLVVKTQSLLDNYASASASPVYSITFYQSNTNQDFVTVTAVPEPETFAMMLAGLGLMGTVARRRRNRQA